MQGMNGDLRHRKHDVESSRPLEDAESKVVGKRREE